MKILLTAIIFLGALSCDPDDECICYEIYAPVCGCDGVEYANDCFAECAGVSYTEGPCPVAAEGLILDWGPVPADGCDWVVQIDTTYYHPDTLAPAFKVNNLGVSLKYKITQDTFLCGWAVKIPVIEVVEMEAL